MTEQNSFYASPVFSEVPEYSRPPEVPRLEKLEPRNVVWRTAQVLASAVGFSGLLLQGPSTAAVDVSRGAALAYRGLMPAHVVSDMPGVYRTRLDWDSMQAGMRREAERLGEDFDQMTLGAARWFESGVSRRSRGVTQEDIEALVSDDLEHDDLS